MYRGVNRCLTSSVIIFTSLDRFLLFQKGPNVTENSVICSFLLFGNPRSCMLWQAARGGRWFPKSKKEQITEFSVTFGVRLNKRMPCKLPETITELVVPLITPRPNSNSCYVSILSVMLSDTRNLEFRSLMNNFFEKFIRRVESEWCVRAPHHG